MSPRRISVAALAVVLATALGSVPALGDADPASDVLLGENVFYPYNPPVSQSLQANLNTVTAAAHRAHFPIKVALIATPVDLGAVPTFFGKPKQYAAFLDQEITFAGRVPLLVVMPAGYGVAELSARGRAAVAALAKPAGASSNVLAAAAIRAVRRITAAAGRPLAAGGGNGSVRPGSGGGVAAEAAILVAVCVTLAAGILAARRRRARAPARRR